MNTNEVLKKRKLRPRMPLSSQACTIGTAALLMASWRAHRFAVDTATATNANDEYMRAAETRGSRLSANKTNYARPQISVKRCHSIVEQTNLPAVRNISEEGGSQRGEYELSVAQPCPARTTRI